MVIRSLCRALAGLALSFITAVPLNAAPSISSFTPASGTIGNKVTITGSGFTGATAVKFNGVAASFIVNSGTQITATVPNAAWTGPITVTAGGLTGTSATSFTVTPGMGLSFIVGHPLTSPTVFGAGFHATTGVDLYFDTQNVALFVSSPTGTLSATYRSPSPHSLASTGSRSWSATLVWPHRKLSRFRPTGLKKDSAPPAAASISTRTRST